MSLLPGNISDFLADSNISFPNSVVSYLLLSKEEATTESSPSPPGSPKPKIKVVVIDSKNIQDLKQTVSKVVKLVDASFDLVSPDSVKLVRLHSNNNSDHLIITDKKHILYTVIDS